MNNKFVQASMITDRSKKVKTIDSREVAEMIGKEHKNLIRDIRNYVEIIQGSKLSSESFFIESEYLNSRNQKQPCYLLTKQGCEMVANKMTGKKGILFTAKYVERFNEMENSIQNNLPLEMETMQGMGLLSQSMAAIGQHVQVLTKFTMDMKEYFQDSIQVKDHQIDQAMDLIGIRSKNIHRLTTKLKDTLFDHHGEYVPATDIRYAAARDKVFKEFKVYKWEEISAKQYNAVEAFIESLFD